MNEYYCIGKLNLGVFPDYNDSDSYELKDGYAIIDYGFTAGAYEDIYCNLGGEDQANAFLEYSETHDKGIFYGDGYIIEFGKK